jgi:uncharacterized Zn finger protein
MPRFGRYSAFPEYVSVAERRARALEAASKLASKVGKKPGGKKLGRPPAPVGPLQGRKIATTFWGKAWCENLESYSDYASRLPRGRSYVRHGAVVDLDIAAGKITALVSGSSLYQVAITIQPLGGSHWNGIAAECTGQIDSLIDLLGGNLSPQVMEVVTRRERGLFPTPREISLSCSCPDWADMCKHVAAVLYGVGARLDLQPDLLFSLRGVDHLDLIGKAAEGGAMLGGRATGAAGPAGAAAKRKVLEHADLSSLFGIEIDGGAPTKASGGPSRTRSGKSGSKSGTRPPGRR